MIPMALSLVVWGAAFAQAQPHAPERFASDMNVEVVSLLGQKLYRTPATGDALKKLEAALAEAEKQAAAQPDNPTVHLARAKALGDLWRYHDTIAAYTKALSLAPKDAETYSHRANIFILLRLFDQAKNDYEQATAIAPQEAGGWVGLGITHYLRQKFPDAEKAFAEAAKLSMPDERKKVAGFFNELTQRRLGNPANPAAPDWPWMKDYKAALEKLFAGDKPGAVAAWHTLTANAADWPMLPHIMAEAELSAIEGSKKMKAVTF